TVHQRGGHNGHDAEGTHAFLFNQPENFFAFETLQHDVLSPEQSEEMCDTPAIRVEKRNGVQLDGPVFRVETQTYILRVKVNVSMRQHHALGVGTRTARIEKLTQRVFVDGSDVGAIGRGCFKMGVIVAWRKPRRFRCPVELDTGLHTRNILAKRLDPPEKLLLNKQNRWLRIIQDEVQLARCQPDIQGQQNCTGLEHSVVRLQQAVAIGAEESDAIASLDASLPQGSG